MFLKIEDLYVNYGRLEVLKGVSLDLPEGRISVLLGANGSGKSTLLKTVSGLISPVSGKIWFLDRRINGMLPHQIVRLGLAHVSEGRKIYTPMTVHDNLLVAASCRRDKKQVKKDIAAMYERFPVLGRKRNVQSGKMSGGEQQTLTVAQALLAKPKLLLMDEPSQGLSPAIVGTVAETVTALNKEGLTIVIVEHNLRLGLSLAHRVFVLENGKIAFEASGNDLSGVEYAKTIYLGTRAPGGGAAAPEAKTEPYRPGLFIKQYLIEHSEGCAADIYRELAGALPRLNQERAVTGAGACGCPPYSAFSRSIHWLASNGLIERISAGTKSPGDDFLNQHVFYRMTEKGRSEEKMWEEVGNL